jgi:GNAT superfamily N-acetyltransferase
MPCLSFELAAKEHAKAIERMRRESSIDLTAKLGPGHWSGISKLRGIQERIALGDPEVLHRKTLYIACRDGEPVGSVSVSTFPPGFWIRRFWSEPRTLGLGVFDLVVFPELQGQGLGRFLMEGTEHLARDHDIRFVRLDAYASNPFSTAFYRHLQYDERTTIDLRGCGLVLFEKWVNCER